MFRALRPYQIAVDVGVAVLFATIFIPFETITVDTTGLGTIEAVPMVLLFTTALAIRRFSPALSLAVAWMGAIVQMAFLLGPRPSNIAIFAALYATAAYGTRLVFWLGFASAGVGAVVITVYLYGPAYSLGNLGLTTALAVLAAALFALLLSWVSGALVRTARQANETRRARELAEAQTIAEQERVRIARDMHDVVAHSLTVVVAQADGARYAAASDPAVAADTLGTISTTARAALADVRLLLTQLRHSQGAGPQPTLADTEALYSRVRAAGVELSVEVDPAPAEEPPAALQLAVYRILQEALTNALRHGDGSLVSVRSSWLPDRVELTVRNRRSGEPAPGGHGLIGMRERAQLVAGRLSAGAVGADFVVSAVLPTRSEQ